MQTFPRDGVGRSGVESYRGIYYDIFFPINSLIPLSSFMRIVFQILVEDISNHHYPRVASAKGNGGDLVNCRGSAEGMQLLKF